MACLERGDEGWFAWAVELIKRGLYPMAITVHGPHPYPSDFMWGEADSCKSIDGEYYYVEFRSRRPCRGIWDIHGVQVQEKGVIKFPATFPILRRKDLTPRWKRLLSIAQKERDELRKSTMAPRGLEG